MFLFHPIHFLKFLVKSQPQRSYKKGSYTQLKWRNISSRERTLWNAAKQKVANNVNAVMVDFRNHFRKFLACKNLEMMEIRELKTVLSSFFSFINRNSYKPCYH